VFASGFQRHDALLQRTAPDRVDDGIHLRQALLECTLAGVDDGFLARGQPSAGGYGVNTPLGIIEGGNITPDPKNRRISVVVAMLMPFRRCM
jgi:hypothetical protein